MGTNNDFVSIILVSYKNFEYIEEAIKSILNQKYDNIELILTDDGSPNLDIKKIEKIIQENKNDNIKNIIINVNKYNLGTVKNINIAVKLSNGKYIVPISSDDIFYNENIIEDIVKFFKSSDYLIATAYREVYSEDMKTYIETLPREKDIKYLKGNTEKLYKRLCKSNFISGSCLIYTKKFFEQYGYFDEKYCLLEDYPKCLDITRKGCKIGFINKPTIKYRLGGVSTSKNINPKLENDFMLNIKYEILSYEDKLGIFLRRLNKYELYRKTQVLNNNPTRLNFKYLKYIDIIVYKILKKYADFLTYNIF